MQTVNRDRPGANPRITLTAVSKERTYLGPWRSVEPAPARAATKSGTITFGITSGRYACGNFASWMPVECCRAIAKEKDLTKTTQQHIKSVLSTIFIYAKNEGAFDGANPVDGVLIPRHAKEPGETHAYELAQVLQILECLPLLEKSLVATAALAGLRQGELRGLERADYTGTELVVKRSIWMSVVNPPKTRTSRDSVPVIPALAEILDEYRKSMGSPEAGVVFHSGDGLPIFLDKVGRRVLRRALQAIHLPWYGCHASRRGLASNLYEIGPRTKSYNASCVTRNRTSPENAILSSSIVPCLTQ
jgi:integrase